MIKTIKLSICFLMLGFLFTSCEKDDPEEIIEEEVITTLSYTLTPMNGGSAITLQFEDLDGDGGNNPIINGGTLASNTTYTGSMELLNASESPAEDITEEIMEEDEEHQFFFAASGVNVSVSYDDNDEDGNPVGLSTNITTGDASSGNLVVTLRHEPNKSGNGVSTGDITNAGGETDIEVSFPINVE